MEVARHVFRRERERPPELRVAAAVERPAFRQHADHGVRLAVENQRAADDVACAAELGLPERVAEHDDEVLA